MSHLDDLENGWKKLRKNHKERERLTRKNSEKKTFEKKKTDAKDCRGKWKKNWKKKERIRKVDEKIRKWREIEKRKRNGASFARK